MFDENTIQSLLKQYQQRNAAASSGVGNVSVSMPQATAQPVAFAQPSQPIMQPPPKPPTAPPAASPDAAPAAPAMQTPSMFSAIGEQNPSSPGMGSALGAILKMLSA